MNNEPLDESKKKYIILKSLKHPDELIGEFYYHQDVYCAVEGFYKALGEWLNQSDIMMVEDLLEEWFPDIMKAIEISKVKQQVKGK